MKVKRADEDKLIAILAIVFGILIFLKPDILGYLVSIYLIVWGVTRLI